MYWKFKIKRKTYCNHSPNSLVIVAPSENHVDFHPTRPRSAAAGSSLKYLVQHVCLHRVFMYLAAGLLYWNARVESRLIGFRMK